MTGDELKAWAERYADAAPCAAVLRLLGELEAERAKVAEYQKFVAVSTKLAAKVAVFRRLAERTRDWYFARDRTQDIADIADACHDALEETK